MKITISRAKWKTLGGLFTSMPLSTQQGRITHGTWGVESPGQGPFVQEGP